MAGRNDEVDRLTRGTTGSGYKYSRAGGTAKAGSPENKAPDDAGLTRENFTRQEWDDAQALWKAEGERMPEKVAASLDAATGRLDRKGWDPKHPDVIPQVVDKGSGKLKDDNTVINDLRLRESLREAEKLVKPISNSINRSASTLRNTFVATVLDADQRGIDNVGHDWYPNAGRSTRAVSDRFQETVAGDTEHEKLERVAHAQAVTSPLTGPASEVISQAATAFVEEQTGGGRMTAKEMESRAKAASQGKSWDVDRAWVDSGMADTFGMNLHTAINHVGIRGNRQKGLDILRGEAPILSPHGENHHNNLPKSERPEDDKRHGGNKTFLYAQKKVDHAEALPSELMEYSRRGQFAVDAFAGRPQAKYYHDLPDETGHQFQRTGILSSTDDSVQDTWMQGIASGYSLSDSVGRTSMAKLIGTETDLGLRMPVTTGKVVDPHTGKTLEKSRRVHSDKRVGGSQVLHAIHQEITNRATDRLSQEAGLIDREGRSLMPSTATQAIGWTGARRFAGGDSDYNTAVNTGKLSHSLVNSASTVGGIDFDKPLPGTPNASNLMVARNRILVPGKDF